MANDARAYIPPLDDSWGMVMYGQHYSANELYSSGDLQTDDVEYKTDIGIARLVWYPRLGPYLTSFQAIVPFGKSQLEMPGSTDVVTDSGVGDPTFLGAIYIIDDIPSKTWLAVVGYLTAPMGKYENDKLVNMGANRWKFKGELGLSKGFGKFYFDLTAGASWFGDNDEYGPKNDVLKQDVEYHFEAHASYNLTPSVYVELDYGYLAGGKTYQNGYQITKSKNNHNVQVGLAFVTAPQDQFMIYYSRDLQVEDGLKLDMLGVRYIKFF
jgi:hypothetical protein